MKENYNFEDLTKAQVEPGVSYVSGLTKRVSDARRFADETVLIPFRERTLERKLNQDTRDMTQENFIRAIENMAHFAAIVPGYSVAFMGGLIYNHKE